MDFTFQTYKSLLTTLQSHAYIFQIFREFLQQPAPKVVVLRHDVDKLPANALKMAQMEHGLGVVATYYFRAVPESWDEGVIREIAAMGHEIGYHYENLSLCRGNYELAIKNFRLNLEKLREFYPVKTICMHGSPLSKYDNKKIWEKYDYRDFGIIAEPYLDVDFDEVFYLTDTGRMWNNEASSIRDKVSSKFDIRIKDTFDLIEKIRNNELPDRIMINVHPQRWNDHGYNWYKELIVQNFKNVIKRYLIKLRN
jgi:hypothetical protein